MQKDTPIIDSQMTKEEALAQNPAFIAPKDIIDSLELFDVLYYSFENKLHKGQLVMHKDVVSDVQEIFSLLCEEKFPIQSCIPISDKRFTWDDEASMQANNTSAYNYRFVARTNRLSNHAQGFAIDINPLFNPQIIGEFVQPKGAVYDKNRRGTIIANSPIVTLFKERGWNWGGDWEERTDYQHFSKLAKVV